MISLITAVPGSGKTLYAIELIEKYNNEKRLVYQNIEGLKKEKFPYPDLILDAPDDWRDTPHGSVVIYDEAQQAHLYPATARAGAVHDERLSAMETHRHSGHDLIFITQATTLIHHHIRKLTGLHIHLYRARGLQKSSRYEWSHVSENPNDRKEQERADFTFWNFPKKYYDYYQSATIHTHKFSMPKKLKILISILIPSFIYLFYNLSQSELLFPKEEVVQESNQEKQHQEIKPLKEDEKEDSVFSMREVVEFANVSGCVANQKKKKCTCYNYRGNPLELNYQQCLLISNSSITKSMIKGGRNSNP